MHTRLIAWCWLIPMSAGAQPFIASYEHNDLEKCIQQCDKEIDKGGDKQLAYLYKSKAYHRKYSADNSCLTCLTKSMNSLEMLAVKDADGVFRQGRQADTDSILTDMRAEVREAILSGPSWFVDDLLPRMEKFSDHYYEKYLRGLQATLDDDLYQATKWYNEAARQIYLEWKNGKQPADESLEVFSALGDGLIDFNDHRSAITVWQRALKMYPRQEVLPAYESFLNQASHNSLVTQNDSMLDIYLQAYDSLAIAFPELQVNDMLTGLLLYADEYLDTPVNFIAGLVCARYPALMPVISDSLMQHWESSVAFTVVRGKLRSTWDQEAVENIIQLSTCAGDAGFEGKPPAHRFHQLVSSDPVMAAYWYYCLTEHGQNLSEWNADLSLLTGKLNDMLEEQFTPELYTARLALPADKKDALELLDISLRMIKEQIDQGDFSGSGEWLRGELSRDPENEQLRALYKYWVTQDYLLNLEAPQSRRSHLQWKGDPDKCDAGTLPEEAYTDFMQAMNYLRRLAGVPDSAVLLPEWNEKCQAAALMMHAEGHLSHQPGSNFQCFSKEGQQAAGMSNLSLGYGGIPALLGQVYDSGSSNGSVGHRRWVLTPYRRLYGMGSTDDAMALWTLGGRDANFDRNVTDQYTDRFVAWPPEWYFPAELMPYRWSFSMGFADFSSTTIRVFHGKKEIPVHVLPLEQGYGQNTIVWEIFDLPPLDMVEQSFRVEVRHVLVNSQPMDYTYEVISLPIME